MSTSNHFCSCGAPFRGRGPWFLILIAFLSAPAATAHSAGSLREGDEFWMLSSRSLTSSARCANIENPDLRAYHYQSCNQFTPASRDELLARITSDPHATTVIYTHGNRFDCQDAIERGWFVYNQLARHRCHDTPMRFVLWSWPSDRIKGVLKDVRLKAERTDAQGLYLGWVLRQTAPAPRPLTLIGYSFGGRVVTGALHAAAGGSLAGRTLSGPAAEGLQVRVGLVAAAVDREWLHPDYYHGKATQNMARLSLLYNPRDSILRRYWLLEPDSGAEALGANGPVRVGRRADGSRLPVSAYDCSRTVGIQHDELDYYTQDCKAGCILARLIATPDSNTPDSDTAP